jgi:hypothetical protein
LARATRRSKGDEPNCAGMFLYDVFTAQLQLPARDEGDLRSRGGAFEAKQPRRILPIFNSLNLQHRRRARRD